MTAIDTACCYSGFAAHRMLAQAAGSLLGCFEITTKIGFFPDGHDLSQARLAEAAERCADDLRRPPNVLLLHNPEESPGQFAAACCLLDRLCDQGWCGSWGISTWDPRPLTGLPYEGPAPGVLMSRAGLMVPADILDAADRLAELLAPARRWGMAPFGHDAAADVWSAFDPCSFLAPGQEAAPLEAAFAAAFALPAVERIAVGTANAGHLAQLHRARLLDADPGACAAYRELLRSRSGAIAPGSAAAGSRG